jgi:hypothetical protein
MFYVVELYETINAGAMDQSWRWRTWMVTSDLTEATQQLSVLLAAGQYARLARP